MKKYKEFTVTTVPFLPEIISSVLWEKEITGINEEGTFLKVFADLSTDKSEIENGLDALKQESVISSYLVEENIYDEINWNEEWEKTIKVIEVSEKIVIKPSFRPYSAKPGQTVITIDPKMSFGTGEHQTTKLMIRMIEKNVQADMTVLDVGTGTGVLAIAAVKLGAKSAVAIDNDEWCYDNGIENCSVNNVEDKVEILCGEIDTVKNRDFDLVLANINKNILMEIGADLAERLHPQGKLILSGLLFSDEADITEQYKKYQFKVVDKMQLDEWISLVMLR